MKRDLEEGKIGNARPAAIIFRASFGRAGPT